jgi:hypothetical protein
MNIVNGGESEVWRGGVTVPWQAFRKVKGVRLFRPATGEFGATRSGASAIAGGAEVKLSGSDSGECYLGESGQVGD